MIGIVDIGLCNLRSVEKAVYSRGGDSVFVKDAAGLAGCDKLILPGVGSFRAAMERITQAGLYEAIRAFADTRPVLGICLGMQLLATWGDEGGGTKGLDLVPGRVQRLEPGAGLRVPHIGWNTVELARPHPLFEGIKPNRDFYFVHSFHLVPDAAADVLATTVHGPKFVSAVARGHVVGLQFHPEKSQANGIKIISSFLEWEG